ncbi:MAG: FG-GAP repeat protein [Proteobacteria bacterium]|nr:FG-GAP repeat protein [Pseudomonadota bacterium]
MNRSGAVYVFRRTGTAWQQEAYVKASNTDTGDGFGHSLALSGDTLAVGAYEEDSNATGINKSELNDPAGTNSGAVYVFRWINAVWRQEAYVKASNTNLSDRFGWSVALSGDTLAVGANGESSDATGVGGDEDNNLFSNSGAAYVFRRTDGTWQQDAYIKATNTESVDLFGHSVALSGDTLAVAANREDSNATGFENSGGEDNSATESGAAYLYRRPGQEWLPAGYVKASNTGQDDQFGTSMALSADALVIGAFGESSGSTGGNGDQADDSVTNSGAIYVFH